MQAASVLEDPDTVDAAARMLALLVRVSFRKDLPGTPLERLRSVPNSEPSVPFPDGHSVCPSDVPGPSTAPSDVPGPSIATSSATETCAGTPSVHGRNLGMRPKSTLSSSLGPSIAGSGIGSNSTPIADTQRLIGAAAGSSGSGSVVPGWSGAASGFSAGFLVPANHCSRSVSPQQQPTPFAHMSPSTSMSAPPTGPASALPSGMGQASSSVGGSLTHAAASAPSPADSLGPAFPPRSLMSALSALSRAPLHATLRHLHLTIVLHLPPRFRAAALQCRATHAPGSATDDLLTNLDLSRTLAAVSPYSRTSPAAAHPFISSFVLFLPSSLPRLRRLSLADNLLHPADALALSGALCALPELSSLDLSENPDLTAAAVATMVCRCPDLKTTLTHLGLRGCSRNDLLALAGALNFLENLVELSFGPAPPRMGEVPLLAPLADPLQRMIALESLQVSGFGGATLALIPHLPFETLTSLDVECPEDVVAPMHAALADQAPRMARMRRLLLLGWSCTTTDAATIDRFVAAISALTGLEALSMSGAPPHNPDLSPITRLTKLTTLKVKHLSRHLLIPHVRHLTLLQHYCCIKCHTPPAQVYKSVEQSGAAIFSAMRTVELVDCDMDDNARHVTYTHLRGMSHLHALRLTFPTGGNLTNFPRISEMQIFLPMLCGLTRLELSCCHRFLPGSPAADLDFSAQSALQVLRVSVTDRGAEPTPRAFETSVFRSLGTLTALCILDFSRTALADLPSFVAQLAPLTHLSHLCLNDTAAPGAAQAPDWSGAAMARRLGDALTTLTALDRLELCFVPLGDDGAAELAPALGCLHLLRHLGLLKTGISDIGAAALWSHLRALPLDHKVLINSAPMLPYENVATDSMQSGSVAIAQGHTGYPYYMV